MVSVLLTNFGAPSSATVKRTTKGSDFENLSLLGRPRAPRIKVTAIPISSQQCDVWVNLFETLLKVNASSHNPKVYTMLSIRNCPQQPFISDLCSPFPSGQSTIEDFKFSLITWGEIIIPSIRRNFPAPQITSFGHFPSPIFILDYTNQSFISRREQTNFCRSLICNFTRAPGGEFPWKGKISPMLIFKRLASIFR